MASQKNKKQPCNKLRSLGQLNGDTFLKTMHRQNNFHKMKRRRQR